MTTMQAGVYYGPGDIRVEARPLPERTDENLVVKVSYCAICGTELKLATVGNPRCHPPRIIGHEMVGRVEHVGANVEGFDVGDRITLATTVACGQCPTCKRGRGNMCPNAQPISYDFDGAFAEYLAVPPLALSGGNAVKVPDGVGDKIAALSEPGSCAVNAMDLAGVKSGDTVLILGGGPLGAIHAKLCAGYGAANVLVAQRSNPRLDWLRDMEGIVAIDAANEEIGAIVGEATGGLGADVVIVCAPSREPQQEALQYARKGGTVSLFASLPKGDSIIELDSRLIHYSELRVVGASDSRPEHVQKVLHLLESGAVDFTDVITHELPLSKLHQGLELMKTKQCLKVLIRPGE